MAEQPDQQPRPQRELIQGDLLQAGLLQPDLWSAPDGGAGAASARSADAEPEGGETAASPAPHRPLQASADPLNASLEEPEPGSAPERGASPAAADPSPARRPAPAATRPPSSSPGPAATATAAGAASGPAGPAATAWATAAHPANNSDQEPSPRQAGARAGTGSAAGSAPGSPPERPPAAAAPGPYAAAGPSAGAGAAQGRGLVRLPTLAGGAAPADQVTPGVPELILILDTETTGLDPAEGVCIEVGAVLFHVGQRAVLQQLSFLLPCEANPAEPINGIPAAVTRLPQPWRAALSCFEALVESADAVVAHNAAFDRRWFGHGALPRISRPWICSMEDIRWPAERQLRATPSVRDLALAYGVPVWSVHRALSDCLYLVHVFERCADLEALLLAALEPRQLYRARLSYAERHRAREAGFRWNEPVAGAWSRRLSRREVEALPFPVVPVAAEPQADPLAHAS